MSEKSENSPQITAEERRRIEEISSHAKATSTRSRYGREVVKVLSWLEDRGEDATLPVSPGLVLVLPERMRGQVQDEDDQADRQCDKARA